MEGNLRWVAVTAIAPVAWGSAYFVTQHLLPAESPLFGAVYRALPAGILLLLITRSRPRGSWWWKSAVLGTLNVGTFFALVYVSAQLLPSSVASTLMALSPAVMMLLAWPMLADRPRALTLVGAAIGIGGVFLLLGAAGGTADLAGVLASLAAMTLSSFGFILTKRWNDGGKVLPLTAWQLVAGGLVILPLAIIVEGAPPALDPPAILGFAYLTLIATAAAYVAWFTGLRHLTAGTVGLIGLLNPVTGVLLGTAIGGEAFGIPQLIGMVLVLIGILLGQPAESRRRRQSLFEGTSSARCRKRTPERLSSITTNRATRSSR
ncbi:EamA family transporter [Mycetocola zhadangensis]|uniref:EamA family transporter n=1 Tax=Mycetocola zhadangensis TaxID=1164595 RepID=A0A3L7J4Q9_9MICO|nr:EamA family transporter [Mycetocola zhadangensis]RLQ85688.1 EamA family transporter [Mycetocola zhadangensis]